MSLRNIDVDSIVNDAFSFIYEQSSDGSIHDDSCEDIDKVFDQHFSFLNDVDDSICTQNDKEVIYENIPILYVSHNATESGYKALECLESPQILNHTLPPTRHSCSLELNDSHENASSVNEVSLLGPQDCNSSELNSQALPNVDFPVPSDSSVTIQTSQQLDSHKECNHMEATQAEGSVSYRDIQSCQEMDSSQEGNPSEDTQKDILASSLEVKISQGMDSLNEDNSIDVPPINNTVFPLEIQTSLDGDGPEKSEITGLASTEAYLTVSPNYDLLGSFFDSQSLDSPKEYNPIDEPQTNGPPPEIQTSHESGSLKKSEHSDMAAENMNFSSHWDILGSSLERQTSPILQCSPETEHTELALVQTDDLSDIHPQELIPTLSLRLQDQGSAQEHTGLEPTQTNEPVMTPIGDSIPSLENITQEDPTELTETRNLFVSLNSEIPLEVPAQETEVRRIDPDIVEAVNPGVCHGETSELDKLSKASQPVQPILQAISNGLSPGHSAQASGSSQNDQDTIGFASSISRIVRRSMKRMQQLRISGRRSKRPASVTFAYCNEGIVSDEAEGRRDISRDPHVGLPSVRSPSTSAVLLPSIMASLTPDPPTDTSETVSPHRSTDSELEEHSDDSSTLFNSDVLSDVSCAYATAAARPGIRSTSMGGSSAYPSSMLASESSAITSDGESDLNDTRSVIRPGLRERPRLTQLLRRAEARRRRTMRHRSQLGFVKPLREYWPHSLSGLMACLPLTVNTYNISRFAVFGAKYGWQFPIQWGIISLVFGLPLMTFQMSLGQLVGAGPVDMWVISPIFQGIGYALLLAELVLGVYCCVPITWLFTMFRDSFDMRQFRCITSYDCNHPQNISAEMNEVVPGFFTSNILGRPLEEKSTLSSLGSIQFNLTFNLVSIWIIVFLTISKGAKSLGKVCYLSFLLPLLCYLAVCCYLVYVAVTQLPMSTFSPKFLDKQSWMAASREAFLVWALHGAALQQLVAGNKKGHPLWRDTTVIALITMCSLCLASFCGIVCSTVMSTRRLQFTPSSFESTMTRHFVAPEATKDWKAMSPESDIDIFAPQDVYDNFYVGIRIKKQSFTMQHDTPSGYNSLRLLTEMFPALLFALRIPIVPYIPPLFILSLLLFALAHQITLWYSIVQGIIRLNYTKLRPMETVITFCCCVFGFSAALPMVTGAGIQIIYFMDFIVGSAWWLMILHLIQIFAVLLVRGKPFSAGDIARELFGDTKSCVIKNAASLAWTVLTPVGLVVATISSFQAGDYRKVLIWECVDWPVWVCQVATGLQLLPLLLVILIGIWNVCVFLYHARGSSVRRLQYLYRPPPYREFRRRETTIFEQSDPHSTFDEEITSDEHQMEDRLHDPPPKYTPPPSYSTATGSSLAKILRNSLRRATRTSVELSTRHLP